MQQERRLNNHNNEAKNKEPWLVNRTTTSFRQPCFANVPNSNTNKKDHRDSEKVMRTTQVMSFLKEIQSDDNFVNEHHKVIDPSSSPPSPSTDAGADDNNHENSETKSPTSTDGRKDEGSTLKMEQCISMLAPHLAFFRTRCREYQKEQQELLESPTQTNSSTNKRKNSRNSNDDDDNDEYDDFDSAVLVALNNDDNDDDSMLLDESLIPPQTLRTIRFFNFKWKPMKRALLRPPSSNEVEVGVRYRILLAKVLHNKGFLATAEVDCLIASLEREQQEMTTTVSSSSSQNHVGKKRKRNQAMYDDVRIAFSRFPTDAINPNTANNALYHLKTILIEYSRALKHKEEEETKDNNVHDDDDDDGYDCYSNLPFPCQVCDWALTAFSALVVTNGIDEPPSSHKSHAGYEQMEARFVSLLTNNNDNSGENKENEEENELSPFQHAFKEQLLRVMEPPTIDAASNLNILCLGRLFSYIRPSSTVERYIFHSIQSCYEVGGGAGLSSLPRLILCYKRYVDNEESFEESICLRAKRYDEEYNREKKTEKNQTDIKCFVKLLFDISQYLINSAS